MKTSKCSNDGSRPLGIVPFFVIGDLLWAGVEKLPAHCTLYPLYDPSNKLRGVFTFLINNLIQYCNFVSVSRNNLYTVISLFDSTCTSWVLNCMELWCAGLHHVMKQRKFKWRRAEMVRWKGWLDEGYVNSKSCWHNVSGDGDKCRAFCPFNDPVCQVIHRGTWVRRNPTNDEKPKEVLRTFRYTRN